MPPGFPNLFTCACQPWNQFSGLPDCVSVGNRQWVMSVEWMEGSQEGPSCSRSPPTLKVNGTWVTPVLFIPYLSSADSGSGFMCPRLAMFRHCLLKTGFIQGRHHISHGCLGVNQFMRSLKFTEPGNQDSHPDGPTPCTPNECCPATRSCWEDAHEPRSCHFPPCLESASWDLFRTEGLWI